MSYNFINEAATVRPSPLCYYDTKDGYSSDFSVNGDVDGWDYYDGIHTYGCWNGFLFATLYGSYALLGRTTIFYPVPAETHYFVKVVMKINPTERVGSQELPTIARLQWTTTADSSWNTTKSHDFDIEADNEWHAYVLNMGELQYWQGDVNNLRLYPIYEDGRSGDEIFIKGIKITSINTYRCNNVNCDYYTNYSHPCPGIGTKGYCESITNSNDNYTIEEGVNDDFIININGYGNETIKIDAISNATGAEISKVLTSAISRIGVGGYAEVEIDYTDNNEFIIYSGTYTATSTVIVEDSSVARLLGFFDNEGNDVSTKTTGTDPASGAETASSFKIKSFQTLSLFDNDEDTHFSFDPSLYNVEGGRRDWLAGGLGFSEPNIGKNDNTDASNTVTRSYNIINNTGKTLIDFNHPFNASGRIKKIYVACTLDQGYESVSSNPPATSYEGRLEATGCKVKILRPRRNGNLEVIHSIDIPDRDYSGGRLYSFVQESIDLDCDVFVNKGDLIGIYNANVYGGKSISGNEIGALYYQVNGEVTGEFDPGNLQGNGISGLLIYARSDKKQDKVVLDVDLGDRVNIKDINIYGTVENSDLEYNIARCLDVNWSIDLFGGKHQTAYVNLRAGLEYQFTYTYEHENIAYGIARLSDGIKIVKDGYAASGYTVGDESVSGAHSSDLTTTFVVTDPQYFFVNGDQEWLGIYQHKKSTYAANPFVQGFRGDPIAFTLLFPYGLDKSIYKSVVYFKEKWNFRNFSLSVSYDLNDISGDADDVRFHYIPEYTAVTIDNQRITADDESYNSVDKYLFVNPCRGEPIFEYSGERGPSGEYLGEISNYEEYSQASNLDWSYLVHEFEPITCKGFRFYCDYHYSTKLTEMEVYCRVEDIGSNLVGGMDVTYSYYEDLWWQASLEQNSETSVVVDIEDTPRYFSIEISPITNIKLSEIRFNVKNEELYIGQKGCEYELLPIDSKINTINTPQITYVKNVYNSEYDLYVDIADDEEAEDRLVFHTKLNNQASITDPEIGPDATYYKSEDYLIVGNYKNCAINCDCWGLRNLIDGKKAYYSNNNGYTWNEFGTLASGVNIDFSNITSSNFSIINIPVYYRDRYWKIGWLCEDHVAMNVREMIPFYNGEELACTFYHDKELPFEDGPISDTAPHIRNDSVTGSYYKLQGGTNIGMDLGSQKVIDQILWFHDSIADYDTLRCGIDKYTKLNLTIRDSNIIDYSYDERSFSIGTGITAGHGKWDFDYNEVTTVSGLYSDSDTNPTSITMPIESELVDGVLWDEAVGGNGITLTTNHSLGVDLGSPKEVTRIRFYLNLTDGYTGLSWRNDDNNWYIYSSNDNSSWTLCYQMINNNPQLQVQDNSWEFFSEFFFPVNQTARYFKVWCEEPMYVYAIQSWYNIPTCSEIKVFSEISNSYKTGIEFPGDHSSYITVPASNDLIFPGTSVIKYGALAKPFTIDFHVKFNSLPVTSGTDYCTLIRNWPDPVTTSEYGDVQFPPENWMDGVVIDKYTMGYPDASYAIFVRSIYNLARADGTTYSSSTISNGVVEDVFDGDILTFIQFNTLPSYVQCNLPEAKKVIRYGIATYPHQTTSRRIRSWDLQGYITASGTWINLHSVSNFSDWDQYQVNYWDFTNPYDACTQYKLNITANWGDTYTYLYELELYDDSEGITPVLYTMEFWTQSSIPYDYYGGRWSTWNRVKYEVVEEGTYHVSMTRGDDYTIQAYVNGDHVGGAYGSIYMEVVGMISHSEDVIIGEGLNGVISDFRITKDIERIDQQPQLWHKNERFYTMSIYTSTDNVLYGKYCDIDLYKENSYSVYDSDSVFSSDYYCQLAIDLDHSYDLELIRSYGNSDTQPFSIWGENSTDIYYSNDDVVDVSQVSWATRNAYANIKTLYSSEVSGWPSPSPGVVAASKLFTAVDCTGLTKDNGMLVIDIKVSTSGYIDTTILGQIEITSAGTYDSEEWHYVLYNMDLSRITDEYQTFYFLLRDFNTTGGELDVSQIDYIRLYVYCTHTNGIYLYWRNAKVMWSIPDAITVADDVRWLRFDLLSGDGVSKIIRKLGVYPDISTQIAPCGGYYNHEWDYLGKSITAYESSTNLALGATVSGSDYFGMMLFDYVTDGTVNTITNNEISEESSLYEVWGSNESNPWLRVDLGSVYSVYRFKIYHGSNATNTDYMITDYEVQTSTDGQIYTTHFSITDNDEFERTHDLVNPVQARYIKLNITSYNSIKVLLRVDLDGSTLEFFDGAVLREIEVYEYYGYPVINSEEYPVVAINMLDQFYLSTHSIIGMYTEDSSSDWVNENYNFCYSDSVLNEPSKVDFREWDGRPYYDQWAVVKMNTAENYRNGPHYLKHVRIESAYDQNPCSYPWWWQSSISTLSRDYNYYIENSTSALKIEYPASTTIDEISFIEGDDFGIDTLASWRDGFSFRIRIDDVNNLDRSYGYFYFGGYDVTSATNPVVYKWYLTTLSGSIETGWNDLFLRFKAADEIEYTESNEITTDIRIVKDMTLGTIGMVYRGVGNDLTMHLDGFKIERNRFYDYSAHDVGCYLNNTDYITTPIGEYDMSKGTIEFWMRPDYDYKATDYYGTLRNRAIFSFNNNVNDVFGFLFGYNGFQIYFGNTGQTLNIFSLEGFNLNILDVMFHVGLVFSNDGKGIDSDGSTVRLYINGYLMFKSTETWEVQDNKHFVFVLGGTAPLNVKVGSYIETSSVDAVLSDFKIYNYCKTDFFKSMRNEVDLADKLIKPSNFIELSKDNLTYYKIRDSGLPLVYENVAPGTSVPVYVRTSIPKGLTGKELRTAGLKVAWDIAV